MKIILSRKGFDSSVGGVASPILPAGELCSLPIPESTSFGCSRRYDDLRYGEHELSQLIRELTRGRMHGGQYAHLDPDLNGYALASGQRLPGWRPLFGQAGAAERHLQNMGVQDGDLFLFYGWFRQVEVCGGRYRYVPEAPNLQVLFGWLQIERRIPVALREDIPEWALYHPHCRREEPGVPDSLYVATEQLTLPGFVVEAPGGGIFPRYHPSLCLTNCEPYQSRRLWRVPEWMYPMPGKKALTYHANLAAWQCGEGYALLRSAARGQEFVLDCEEYTEAVEWAAGIIGDTLSGRA